MTEGTSLKEVVEKDIQDDVFPKSNIPNARKNEVIYFFQDMNSARLDYTDLTGRFHYQSSRGNKYVVVAYHYDGNVILIK